MGAGGSYSSGLGMQGNFEEVFRGEIQVGVVVICMQVTNEVVLVVVPRGDHESVPQNERSRERL